MKMKPGESGVLYDTEIGFLRKGGMIMINGLRGSFNECMNTRKVP